MIQYPIRLFSISAILLVCAALPGCTSWSELGKIDAVVPRGFSVNLGFNNAGIPHLGIQAIPNRPQVARFENDRWTLLPNPPAGGFLVAMEDFGMLGDVPYALIRLGTNDLQVSRLVNGAWADLNFLPRGTNGRLTFRNSQPCVAYRIAGGTLDNRAAVSCYNGSTWAALGAVGFSAGNVNYITMAVAADQTPYVAYQDPVNGGKATVMRYSGNSWAPVGSAGFSPDDVDYMTLVIDRSNQPVVAFSDLGEGGKLSAMGFNGTAWEFRGPRAFTPARAGLPVLVLNERNRPAVVYRDNSEGSKAGARELTGDNVWTASGLPGFTPGPVTVRIAAKRKPGDQLIMATTITPDRPVVMHQ